MPARRFLLAAVAALVVGSAAVACPFCSSQGQTLSGEINQADIIVLGTLTNAQRDKDDFTKGTTDLVIDTVVKPHEYLTGKKVLTLPRYVPGDPNAPNTKFLVFCSLYNRPADLALAAAGSAAVLANPTAAVLDPYRGEPVKADSKLPEYLKGAIAVRQKGTAERLRYFFDYLDAPELVVSTDAMMEFGNSDYKDVRQLAETLPADKILKWLRDPNTPASRFGLYGLFIAHCGKKQDAPAVRALLDDAAKQYSSGLDGLVAAYVMLDKQAGWAYLTDLCKDGTKDFQVRYAALKVCRFFEEFRPDVVSKDEAVAATKLLCQHADMADLPIEDLRKWGRWEATEFVLQFGKQESHNKIPIVRRAILRFALTAGPANKAAAAYVAEQRAADPEKVKLVEEMLKDEQPKPTAAGGQ